MSSSDQSTNTEPTRSIGTTHLCCGLRWKDILTIISQCLLPLILAIFTIVITFDQRNENRLQRLEDRRLADEQREQDLNISRDQRENDRWIAEEQRQHDKQIAAEKRAADDLNADIQRNMTRDQRLYEVAIEQERYKKEHEKYLDHLLLSYYNEIGDLLQKDPNKSLSSYPIRFSLARAKTLNVIEQVGRGRAVQLLMFLYGTGQLTSDKDSFDLTNAQLEHADFRNQQSLTRIRLAGAHLNGAVFDHQDLFYADFRNAQLINASFRGAICTSARFDNAHLIGADFTGANITNASFVNINAQRAIFSKVFGRSPLFKYSRLQYTNFAHSVFAMAPFDTRGFLKSNLEFANFRHASLVAANLLDCNLTGTDFSYADIRRGKLDGSVFSRATLIRTDFGWASLSLADFSYTNLTAITCSGTILDTSACRLNQVWSLAHAHLPNNSIGPSRKPFFTDNEYPHCQKNILGEKSPWLNSTDWQVYPANSMINEYRSLSEPLEGFHACVFVPIQTTSQISMSRFIDLKEYAALIQGGMARVVVSCSVGLAVMVNLRQYHGSEVHLDADVWITDKWTELLKPKVQSLQLTVRFHEPKDQIYSWFLNLQVHIIPHLGLPDNYDTY